MTRRRSRCGGQGRGQVAGLKATGKAAAKSGIIAAVIEAPSSCNRKLTFIGNVGANPCAQAAKAAAMSTAGAGAVGVGATAGAAASCARCDLGRYLPDPGTCGSPACRRGRIAISRR